MVPLVVALRNLGRRRGGERPALRDRTRTATQASEMLDSQPARHLLSTAASLKGKGKVRQYEFGQTHAIHT